MLKQPEKCNIGCVNHHNRNAMMYACSYNNTSAAMTLLDNIELFDINIVSNGGNSSFYDALNNKMNDVARKMYPHLDDNTKYNNYDRKYTPLMIAISNSNSEIALLLLENPKLCYLNTIFDNGHTSLTLACENKLSDVACKILENITLCEINHKINGESSAQIMIRKNMSDTLDVIIEYSIKWNHFNRLENILNGTITRSVFNDKVEKIIKGGFKQNKKNLKKTVDILLESDRYELAMTAISNTI